MLKLDTEGLTGMLLQFWILPRNTDGCIVYDRPYSLNTFFTVTVTLDFPHSTASVSPCLIMEQETTAVQIPRLCSSEQQSQ